MTGLKLSSVLALLLFFVFQSMPAHAQATRTWVSGVGDDANPCSRTAPCKTFAGAISKTAARGEISVLDPGGFGAVTIPKSISIINYDSGEAGILAAGTNGVVINAAATDVVILRGLVIDGGTAAVPGLNGIRFIAGAALHVQDCIIKNFSGTAPNGHGILFAPSAGTSELYVSDTTLSNNGNAAAASGAGIAIQPTGSGSVRASISNVRVENNNRGILADSLTTTSNATKVSVTNSVVAGNTGFGISAQAAAAGGVPVSIMVSGSSIVNNAAGIISSGTAATVRVGSSTIAGSTVDGLRITNGGILQSYKNNQVNDNAADGTPVPAVGLN
jgi:hypothetical protein